MTVAPLLDADFVVGRRAMTVSLALRADAGRRVALFGPSGAGKSTCLEALAGTVPLRRGQVLVAGRASNVARRRRARGPVSSPPRDRGVSLVRQPTTLFPHLTARANVAYGLGRDGVARAESALDAVGLHHGRGARPTDLSGGQRQRVALARALARPFRLLLLDEPCAALDAASRPRLLEVAVRTAADQGAVAVLVTHDLGEAQSFGEVLGVIEDGALLQLGEPGEVVRHPSTSRVAQLVGYSAFLRHDGSRAWGLHPDRFAPGADATSGVVIACAVRAVRSFGTRFACELAVDEPGRFLDGSTTMVAHLDFAPAVGDRIEVTAIDPPLVGVTGGGA